jgi:hypothetical protein
MQSKATMRILRFRTMAVHTSLLGREKSCMYDGLLAMLLPTRTPRGTWPQLHQTNPPDPQATSPLVPASAQMPPVFETPSTSADPRPQGHVPSHSTLASPPTCLQSLQRIRTMETMGRGNRADWPRSLKSDCRDR